MFPDRVVWLVGFATRDAIQRFAKNMQASRHGIGTHMRERQAALRSIMN
jgi:hypothetical protein